MNNFLIKHRRAFTKKMFTRIFLAMMLLNCAVSYFTSARIAEISVLSYLLDIKGEVFLLGLLVFSQLGYIIYGLLCLKSRQVSLLWYFIPFIAVYKIYRYEPITEHKELKHKASVIKSTLKEMI